jgi:3-methylcrotonyl-CoA carboxylase alpha subunit
MFINYEHKNNVYSVTIERRKDTYFVTYDNTEYKVSPEEIKPGHLKIQVGDRLIKAIVTEGDQEKYVFIDGNVFKVKPVELTGRKKKSKKESDESDLDSPISGKIVNVKVKTGDIVKKGEVLMVIEAMKMEYLIRAPYKGKIKKIHFKENDQVEIGQTTIEIEKK